MAVTIFASLSLLTGQFWVKKRAAGLPLVQPFLAAFSARFSFKVFSGFFLVSFFLSMPFAMTLSPCVRSSIESCSRGKHIAIFFNCRHGRKLSDRIRFGLQKRKPGHTILRTARQENQDLFLSMKAFTCDSASPRTMP